MTRAGSILRAFARPRLRDFALAALLLTAGCGNAARDATIFRVQRGYWFAYRIVQEAMLSKATPDSSDYLASSRAFARAIDQAASDIRGIRPGAKVSEMDLKLLRVVGYGEVEAAKMALLAGRPDLALERCQAFMPHAEAEPNVARKIDILIPGALRSAGRHEEAITAMKALLVKYPPRQLDSTTVEDFVLGLPSQIVEIRQAMGDEAGVKRENEAAREYFQSCLKAPGLGTRLEAQLRLHLVHCDLDLGRRADALAGLDAVEALAEKDPSIASMVPEIRYTRVKLTSAESRNPAESAATLQRIAVDFPGSPVVPLALLDAGLLLERANQQDAALAAYRDLVTRFPDQTDQAATATFRQAQVLDRQGHWDEAKGLLEGIPTLYPRSPAAAVAPLAIADHYYVAGDKGGEKLALRRAVQTYERMISLDSLAATTVRLRSSLLRGYARLGDTRGFFRSVDRLVASNPGSIPAREALLAAANMAQTNKLRAEESAYLTRFLQAYPGSPEAEAVRARLRELAKK